ncbi:MAG: TetR family transcriptional regulator [Chloroflexi bacterium]|nr:TetR family transcriptional regulator [Chloroflexota bacterium]
MPRRTKDEANITRQALLDAALTVFSRMGYNATRLEAVAVEAGVTRGAIYHHFGGKAELYTALMNEVSAEINPLIDRVLCQDTGALEKLRGLFVLPLEYAASNTRYREASELMFFRTEALPELEAGWNAKISGINLLVGLVAEVIQRGQNRRRDPPNLDARDAAVTLMSLQSGLLAVWIMSNDLIDLQSKAGDVADIFLRGIAI